MRVFLFLTVLNAFGPTIVPVPTTLRCTSAPASSASMLTDASSTHLDLRFLKRNRAVFLEEICRCRGFHPSASTGPSFFSLLFPKKQFFRINERMVNSAESALRDRDSANIIKLKNTTFYRKLSSNASKGLNVSKTHQDFHR